MIEAVKSNSAVLIQRNSSKYSDQDLNARDALGNTAVYYATTHMNLDCLQILVTLGADVNRRCELGNTPLHMALMVGERVPKNVEVIDMLMKGGARNDLKNDFG